MSYESPLAPIPAPVAKTSLDRIAAERARRHVALTRRFEIEWLDETGEIRDMTRIAPALPAFEEAFSAFTHGNVIQTAEGKVAVEDLLPGTMIATADGGETPLLWKGSITLVPSAPSMRENPNRLYRLSADALGLGRPFRDVLLGPDARILNRDPVVRAAVETSAAFVPVSSYADGVAVTEIQPAMPVRVYHLRTARHATILADGLEVETYHPRSDLAHGIPLEMLEVFLTFFPGVTALRDFGRARWPRMSEAAMELL